MREAQHNPKIFFYIIFDTNWLLNEPATEFIVPKAPVYSNPFLPWSTKEIIGYIWLPVELIIPKQVKAEIAKLHEEKVDHVKTANAKRHYASLQRYFGSPVKQFVRAAEDSVYYEYNDFV